MQRLICTICLMLGLAATSQAQSFTALYNFTGQSDGANPFAGVTLDQAGNFYGTTSTGGQKGFGNVYRMAHSGAGWTFYSLYSFQGLTELSQDGASPYARVIIGPDGALYGTTHSGGNGEGCRELHGCGTVFKLQPSLSGAWKETMIFQFGYYDGEDPYYGDLVFDPAGNIYGATRNGGANLSGAVFELTPRNNNWVESVVYSFAGADGSAPLNGPVLDASGNLYGTTSAGGANGLGAVYRLQPGSSGWTQSVLHSFQGTGDGSTPASGIVLDQSGNVYGATETAGAAGGGTAFELSSLSPGLWNINTLFGFRGAGFGGSHRTLTMDSAGNLYGTTAADGAHQRGSVFKLTHSNGTWTYTSLHDFTGGSDGAYPYGALSIDALGNIYGTASAGGTSGYGVVFQITQ